MINTSDIVILDNSPLTLLSCELHTQKLPIVHVTPGLPQMEKLPFVHVTPGLSQMEKVALKQFIG